MTQLALGLDRDSELISHLFDERDEAVKCLWKDQLRLVERKNTLVSVAKLLRITRSGGMVAE